MFKLEIEKGTKTSNKPSSLLSDILSELQKAQEELSFLSRISKKTKNKKKIFQIITEIKEAYKKSACLKKEINAILAENKEDEKKLLKLLEHSNTNLKKIHDLLKKKGLIYSIKPHFLITKVEKIIIRADYNGTINPITDEKQLSRLYLEHRDNKKSPTHDYKDYSCLKDSKAWALFSQFKNFQNLETFVKKYLYSIDYPPEKIKKLVIEDFIDLFYQEQTRRQKRLFMGEKKSFIKDFIKKAEPQFKQILRNLNVDEKYITALVVSMKVRGSCDKIKVYDKKGNLIEGPRFSVHHKVAVKDGNSQEHLAEVNLFKNLCLTIDEPYHSKILHRLDKTVVTDEGKIYQHSIDFENPNIIFMGGLSPLHQIYYDYENDERTIRRANKIKDVPRVNIKMKGEPTSTILDDYEKRMKKNGKKPIDLRTYMKVRDR